MAINLYDFHDIIRETYNEYVSRYEIDLVDFKNEYGADSEPKFIEYQRIYLSKMRDYIIENLSKIDNKDLDSQFYHDKLQEALSDNKKMFHFLNVRLNPMNYTPEPKENASKGIVTSFLDNLNDGRFDKSDMIDFIESRSTIEKLETLIEGIENYIIKYNTGKALNNWEGFQFDEAYKRPLSEESFTTFKELVLSKIDELKNGYLLTDLKIVTDKNEFPSDVFRDYNSFLKFKTYTKRHIISFYKDFSYLKKRMEKENFIMRITDYKFAEWLFENGYINSKEIDFFYNKLSKFESLDKARSEQRENNFNNIFLINL